MLRSAGMMLSGLSVLRIHGICAMGFQLGGDLRGSPGADGQLRP